MKQAEDGDKFAAAAFHNQELEVLKDRALQADQKRKKSKRSKKKKAKVDNNKENKCDDDDHRFLDAVIE